MKHNRQALLIPAAVLTLGLPAIADQLPTKEGVAGMTKQEYSPYAGRDFPTRVLWGDTLLHTSPGRSLESTRRFSKEDQRRGPDDHDRTGLHLPHLALPGEINHRTL